MPFQNHFALFANKVINALIMWYVQKCCTLYALSECTIRRGSLLESKKCEHIEFPNHPHSLRRLKCNTSLMKRVKINGKFKLVPKKLFVYQSIIQSLMARNGFTSWFFANV